MKNTQEKKIYIDVDEEITTVVDYLRQSNATNIILVVPQRALILQSVVNLRLLAQEAEKRKKILTIMTRDEDGIAFASRAGIIVQPFVSRDDEVWPEKTVPQVSQQEQPVTSYAQKVIDNNNEQRTPDNLGTPTFFVSQTQKPSFVHNDTVKKIQTSAQKKAHMNLRTPVQVAGITAATHESKQLQKSQNKKVVTNHTDVVPQTRSSSHYENKTPNPDKALEEYERSLYKVRLQQQQYPQPVSYDESQYLYDNDITTNDKKHTKKKYKSTKKEKQKINGNVPTSSSTWLASKGLIFGGIALIIIIFLIIVLPWTKITVEPKKIAIDAQMEMTAQVDQSVYDADRRLIPARLIERDVTYTKTFNATGTGDVDAQKAQGTITIFNEYSDATQPLVATTRFLAENGTLFRLVNPVTVPGMKDGEPGKVEALVAADQSGAQGNIGPTRFTIPGFEGTQKYEKFYAISDRSMMGGGAGGNNVTIVTADDIKHAQEEMTKELPSYIAQQISGLLRPDDEMLLDEGITYEIARSEANMGEGTMADQFMYEIVAHTKALVFSQQDVLAVMESSLANDYHQYSEEQVNAYVDYSNIVADFENNSLKMMAHATASDIVATVDVAAFEKDILGLDHDEILAVMEEKYDDEIEKITIESVIPPFPPFIANHISRFAFMTHINVR